MPCCETETTFEHGNLPRGVCPIAEFSQTLIASTGKTAANAFYMTNTFISAHDAQSLGLVLNVVPGVSSTHSSVSSSPSSRGLFLLHAGRKASRTKAVLAREATFGHATCRLANGGRGKQR